MLSPFRVLAGVAVLAALAILGSASSIVAAQSPSDGTVPERRPFPEWLDAFRDEARSRGVTSATIDAALGGLEPLPIVVERDRTQAETVLSIDRYVQRRLTRNFIRAARSHFSEQRTLLTRVAKQYGVQPRFIVAVWGMESNFGRFSGVRPTVPALATLAWEGRREALFRGELFAALEILDRGYIDLPALKGSWAGAMGQTQFMPTSYLKFAEDFDGDGHRDIWRSTPDVFASIANYLKSHGWQDEETWGREVKLPAGGWKGVAAKAGLRDTGCRAHRAMTTAQPMSRWQTLGVRTATGAALPRVERSASLVAGGTHTYLVYKNYETLLDYNCAHPYALTVALLADRIGS